MSRRALLAALAIAAATMLTGFTRDEGWSADDKALLATMSLDRLGPPRHDPSNAFEALPAAAAFGRRLFDDARFSRNGAIACATCHDAARQFQDGKPLGQGIGTGSRRTMPIEGAAHGPWFFWDGRKDSLWSQALGPLEDGAEHGSNRLRIAKLLQANHRREYEAVFGPMPELAGLPDDAGPFGEAPERAAWDGLQPARRSEINRVFANLGKAIAAYERTLAPTGGRFDRYVRAVVTGDRAGTSVFTPQEVNGLRLFLGKGQCATCHNGPLLTDQAFHNTGVPPREASRPDPGRAAATDKVRHDEFNCLGPYSDAPPDACMELRFMAADTPALAGAFKTPGLRGVARRAPYMHAGQLASLDEVIAHYVKAPAAAVGHTELAHGEPGHTERQPIRLAPGEARDLAAFLATL